MEKRIIICRGEANSHARFWAWAVCLQSEFTEEMHMDGWVESQCVNYLTTEQLDYLKF